jgi:hypothetical protein
MPVIGKHHASILVSTSSVFMARDPCHKCAHSGGAKTHGKVWHHYNQRQEQMSVVYLNCLDWIILKSYCSYCYSHWFKTRSPPASTGLFVSLGSKVG